MSGGRRMSTWLAGRNTFTPMSTSRPPLILRVTMPVTTSPSWTVSMTFIQASIFSALRLLRTIMPRSSCGRAGDVFDVFDRGLWIVCADFGQRFAFFPFVAGDDAFALVADVDQHEVVVDAEDAAFDDLIGADVAALEPTHVFGQGVADGDSSSLRPKRRTHELDCD